MMRPVLLLSLAAAVKAQCGPLSADCGPFIAEVRGLATFHHPAAAPPSPHHLPAGHGAEGWPPYDAATAPVRTTPLVPRHCANRPHSACPTPQAAEGSSNNKYLVRDARSPPHSPCRA